MLVEFSNRPFLPPCSSKTNLVTGASGTPSKVVRMPPLTESVLPAEVDVDRLARRAAQAGPGRAACCRRSAGRRACERRSRAAAWWPWRCRRPRRPGTDRRRTAPWCRRCRCGLGRGTPSAAGRPRRWRCWRRPPASSASRVSAGCLPRLGAAFEAEAELRLEAEAAALADLEAARRAARPGPGSRVSRPAKASRVAAGRVEGEARLVEADRRPSGRRAGCPAGSRGSDRRRR